MPYLFAAGVTPPFSIWVIDKPPGIFVLALLLSAVVFFAVMFALHQLSPAAKNWLTIICTFLAGLYFSLEFFLPVHIDKATGEKVNFITPTIDSVSNFVMVTLSWTLGLGLISLVLVHGRRLYKRQPGWHHSLAFFLALIAMIIAGFATENGTNKHATFIFSSLFTSLYFGLYQNLDSTMFSLLAFYIASAAYRAFRVRTAEAAVLMIAAFVVMLGFVSFGVAITSHIPDSSLFSFFRLEKLSVWVLQWLNMPAYRAVGIGVAIGALAMQMRIWLSLERGVFFSQEK